MEAEILRPLWEVFTVSDSTVQQLGRIDDRCFEGNAERSKEIFRLIHPL